MRIFWALILLVISPLALATPSVFSIPPLDQSMLFLSEIFGQVGTILGGSPNTPLKVVILAFNNAALVIGGIIIIYATLVSTINTAHDGELLGKNWSSVWIPLRASAGFALLLPISTGVKVGSYCVIQAIIMWIVVQGVGAGDYVWTTYLKSVVLGNTSQGLMATSSTSIYNATQIFYNAACMYAYQDVLNCETGHPNSVCPDATSPTTPLPQAVTQVQYPGSMMDPGSMFQGGTISFGVAPSVNTGKTTAYQQCGTLQMPQAQPGDLLHTNQNEAVVNMVQSLTRLASVYSRLNYCVNPNTNQPDKNCIRQVQNQIVNAANDYSQQLVTIGNRQNAYLQNQGLVDAYKQKYSGGYYGGPQQGPINPWNTNAPSSYNAPRDPGHTGGGVDNMFSNTKGLENVMSQLAQAQQYGWMYAGTYYMLLMRISGQAQPSPPNLQIKPPTVNIGVDPTNQQLAINLMYVTQYCDTAVASVNPNGLPCIPRSLSTGGPSSTATYEPIVGQKGGHLVGIVNLVNQIFSALVSGFIAILFMGMNGNTILQNPIVMMATLGHNIVLETASAFLVFTEIVNGVTAFGVIPDVGRALDSMILNMLIIAVLPLFGLLASVMGIAAMAAFYLPMIPFLLFGAGTISWLILVIEAIVSGPIVALGIVHPEGQHSVWGRAERGIFMLLGVCLRPALMIIGFIAASLLVYIATNILISGYKVAFSFMVNGSVGPFATLFYYGTFTSFLVFLLHRCFTLIHILPDRVLTWLGESGQSTGQEAERLTQEGGEKASQKASRGAHAAVGGAKTQMKGGAEKAVADKQSAASAKQAAQKQEDANRGAGVE